MQGWCYVESLTGQRHDRVQTESKIETVDSWFDLVGSRHHGVDGCIGVMSWCVISSVHFPWNVNLGNNSSWLVIWRFCVIREEPELLTDIRDFTIQFYVTLRRKFPEWLEWFIESDLGMRFAIWSLDLVIRDFSSFKHCFWCKNRSL